MNLDDVVAELDTERGVRWIWWAIGIVFAFAMAACISKGADRPPDPVVRDASRFPGFEQVAFQVQPAEGEGIPSTTEFCALHARTDESRARGLMEQKDLAGFDAMIFEYESESTSRFYMKNTIIPLSIAWFGTDGAFVAATDMEPCPTQEGCPRYGAAAPYKYALETTKGDLPRLGIGPRSRLEVGGSCAPSG